MESHSKTITVVEEKVSKKAKNTLYLVLKKRGFEEEVIEKMNTELERRFLEVLKRITPRLSEMHFDNPEEALEYILLKEIIKILDDFIKENMLNLNEDDKKIVIDLLGKQNEENKNQNPQMKSKFRFK